MMAWAIVHICQSELRAGRDIVSVSVYHMEDSQHRDTCHIVSKYRSAFVDINKQR
jgi:hypothetical protein